MGFRKHEPNWTDEHILYHISKTDPRPRCVICKFGAVPDDNRNLRFSQTCSYSCESIWERKMEQHERIWRRY